MPRTPQPTHPRYKTLILLAFAAILLTYSNHFHNAFHFDDFHTITDNPAIRSLHNIPRFFTDANTFSVLPPNRTYRPILSATLALDYALAHGNHPLWFHIDSFFFFLLQLACMGLLFASTLHASSPQTPTRNRLTALFAATWFGLHPAIAETVNYIIQRGDILSTLGLTAALLLYIRRPNLRRTGLYLVPLTLGLLAKPPALIFPFLLLAWILLFAPPQSRTPRALTLAIAPSLLLTAALLALSAHLTPKSFAPADVSASAYLLTQPFVALRYFAAFFLPIHLNVDTDLHSFHSLTPQVIAGFVFLAALLAAIVLTARRRTLRPIAFGLLWFLLGLLPTSLYPLAEVENGHRMFLPFVGLVFAVSFAITRIFDLAIRICHPKRAQRVEGPASENCHPDPELVEGEGPSSENCHPDPELVEGEGPASPTINSPLRNCHPERAQPVEGPASENCHPERSEGPASEKNCHPERSEGPASPTINSPLRTCHPDPELVEGEGPASENCHPERSEGPASPAINSPLRNCHPERAQPVEGPASENCHPERSEGPASPTINSPLRNCHPERAQRVEGPASEKNCHPERSEGPASPTIALLLAILFLAPYAYGTHLRNQVWHTEESLWHDDILKSPHNGRGLMIYGLTQMQQGKLDRALACFQLAQRYTPNYATLEINLGVVYSALHQDSLASQHFLRALNLAPASGLPHLFYGRFLLERQRYPEAISQLRAAILLNPTRPDAQTLLAQALAAQSAAPAATPLPTQTVPNTPESLLNLSLAQYNNRQYEASIASARRALALRPNYPEAWNNIGAACAALHQYDQAIAADSRALSLRPDFPLARNNLAFALQQKRLTRLPHAQP